MEPGKKFLIEAYSDFEELCSVEWELLLMSQYISRVKA